MACKRELEKNEDNFESKRMLLDGMKNLEEFTNWMKEEGFRVNNKVRITKKDVSSGWGMVATEDISPDELLFSIPRKSILCPQNSPLKQLIEESKEELKSSSGWVELLIVLLHEHCNPSSNWSPYLHMVPSFQHLHLPMFWSEQEVKTELTGTTLPSNLSSDLSSLTHDFNNIVLPFINKHPSLFRKDEVTLELFKRMVAFVMAYSFTEPSKKEDDDDDDDDDGDDNDVSNPPIMVPLADILNHVTKHNAHLKFSQHQLDMRAIRHIRAGEEVYNTYGHLSNQALLHMYGYTEHPDLTNHDTVDICMDGLMEVVKKEVTNPVDVHLLPRKIKHLKNMMENEGGCVVLGRSAVLNAHLLQETLKVLTMGEHKFQSYVENDGWVSDDEDDEEIFEYDNIHKLPEKQKHYLKKFVERHLGQYPSSLEEEESKLTKLTANGGGSDRDSCIKLYSCYLRTGQLRICHAFLKSLSK